MGTKARPLSVWQGEKRNRRQRIWSFALLKNNEMWWEVEGEVAVFACFAFGQKKQKCLYVSTFKNKSSEFWWGQSLPASLIISDALLLENTSEESIFLNQNSYHFTHLLKNFQGVLNCCMKSSSALAEHSALLQFGLLQFSLFLSPIVSYKVWQTRVRRLGFKSWFCK